MPRTPKAVPGPSRLSAILTNLNKAPRLSLGTLRALKVTLAMRNDHFGARHFIKEELPRIRYANPNLDILVNKIPKSPEDRWKPEIVLEFQDGKTRTLDLTQKWSSVILEELMDIAGGERWQRYKEARAAAGEEPPVRDVAPPPLPLVNPHRTGAAAVLP